MAAVILNGGFVIVCELTRLLSFFSLGKVIRMMAGLETMLHEMAIDVNYSPKEAAFVNLFERFASLCHLNIR